MINVYSKALKQTLQVGRIIRKIESNRAGPTLVFFAGIHGNEPSGVFALSQMMEDVAQNKCLERGTVYAISGNLQALEKGIRYIDFDLNRIWKSEYLNNGSSPDQKIKPSSKEYHELQSIYRLLKEIITNNDGPFYFFDLHTTSVSTGPFLTINDTRLNRKFALHYQVPIILGIEEFLEGPLLSYINEQGYIALGFESGQHDSLSSVDFHKAFIYQSLLITNVVSRIGRNIKPIKFTYADDITGVYEIVYRHALEDNVNFIMCSGFTNFQSITSGQVLASTNKNLLKSPRDGLIFMPLYQEQGNDGFFIIKKIPKIFLMASTLLRKIRLDSILTILPGIRWQDKVKKTLKVNQRTARFLAKDLLHLLGYRVKRKSRLFLLAKKRENQLMNKKYKKESWTI